VEFDTVHSILLRPCFPFREQQKMMPPFWEKKISKLSQLQVYLDLSICPRYLLPERLWEINPSL
jgi:hypothetical protein